MFLNEYDVVNPSPLIPFSFLFLGGFLIAFMKDAGYPLKPFDFGVPGKTSFDL